MLGELVGPAVIDSMFTSVLELSEVSVVQTHASADAFFSGSGNRMARLCV